MERVLEPVDAVAGLFDRRFDPRALVIPRRDGKSGTPVEAVALVPDAAGEFERAFAQAAPVADLVLGHQGTDADLAEAIRRPGFGDLDAMTPLQAAIAAACVLYDAPKHYEPYVLVDAWVAARGVAFAVAATIELARFGVRTRPKGEKTPGLRRADHDTAQPPERFAMAARTRRHLAAAGEADYAAAVEQAGVLRKPAEAPNQIISFLFPERDEWADEGVSAPVGRAWDGRDGLATWLLIGAVSTARQARRLSKWVNADALRLCPAATATMVATVGLEATPAIAYWAETYWDAVESRQRVQRLLAGFDSDEAFLALLGQLGYRGTAAVLAEAALRFPERGVRLLAEAEPEQPELRAAVERVLRLVVAGRPEAARTVAPTLAGPARLRVEKAMKAVAAPVPSVALDTLPEVLRTPPWELDREAAKPAVVKGLTAPESQAVSWLSDQERDNWQAASLPSYPVPADPDWERMLAKALGRRNTYNLILIVMHGPEDVARRALRNLSAGYFYDALAWGTAVTVRFGVEAFPAVLGAVRLKPAENAQLLLPFACSEIAPLVADWNLRAKGLRSPGRAWLRRYPALAARTLIPAALGRSGRSRQAAESALRFLAAEGFEDEIRAEAAGYGGEAEAGIVLLLAQDTLIAALPKVLPEVPSWAEPELLPQILTAGRTEALPPAAVRNVVRMLTVSVAEAPYPGLDTVKELCDARSLADFAWALLENWQTADYPAKQSFALDAQRWFGDEETVRRLSPLIRVWPGESGHARAVAGLDVLAAIGGGTALIHLSGLSQKGKFRGLKENAGKRVQAIADELGLTRDELGDRLVPDLGLDGSGSLELDYGPRRFRVSFDEALKPGVVDETGKRLRSLPKPGVKDDADLAPAAYQRFSGLKKDVRALASAQMTRLESAMVARRRWTRPDFEEYFVGHPLLRHLVRRLVWADFRPDGTGVRAAFRVAEDATYADLDDESLALPADARIGLAHPLDLADELTRWSELFADYEILQPFRQLGRPVFALTAEEARGSVVTRFAGAQTPAVKLLGLEHRGWRRGEPGDGGWQSHLLRDLPDGRTAVVDLTPGLSAGSAAQSPDQDVTGLWIGGPRHVHTPFPRHDDAEPLSTLDPVTASELLSDLSEVTGR